MQPLRVVVELMVEVLVALLARERAFRYEPAETVVPGMMEQVQQLELRERAAVAVAPQQLALHPPPHALRLELVVPVPIQAEMEEITRTVVPRRT